MLYGFINYYESVVDEDSRVILSHTDTISYDDDGECSEEEVDYIPLLEDTENFMRTTALTGTCHGQDLCWRFDGSLNDSPNLVEVTHDDTDSTSTVKPIPLYVQDYIFRGAELEEYSLYELMGVAYAKGATKTEMDRYANATEASPSEGRSLWNRRVLFQPQH